MEERREIAREERVVREDDAGNVHVEREVRSDVTPLADRVPRERVVERDRIISADAGSPTYVVTETRVMNPVIAAMSRVVDFAFYLVYLLLGIRFVLGLLAANPAAGFVQWLFAVSEPLFAPFRGIFPNLVLEGGHTILLSVAFAIVIFAVLHALVNAVFRMTAHAVA